jgi:hypothetical protein
MNKHILRDEHFDDVDWAQQRVSIYKRIDARSARRPGTWRWAAAVAATAMIALIAWFGIHHFTQPDRAADSVALLEQEIDEIIDGRVPGALVVLNGWTDVQVTSWETIPSAYDPFGDLETEGGEKEAL